MNIIEHGKNYHEIECPNCKAHLGYTEKEIKVDENEIIDNWSVRKYIICPECNHYITLKLTINGKIEDDGNDIVRFNTGRYFSMRLCR